MGHVHRTSPCLQMAHARVINKKSRAAHEAGLPPAARFRAAQMACLPSTRMLHRAWHPRRRPGAVPPRRPCTGLPPPPRSSGGLLLPVQPQPLRWRTGPSSLRGGAQAPRSRSAMGMTPLVGSPAALRARHRRRSAGPWCRTGTVPQCGTQARPRLQSRLREALMMMHPAARRRPASGICRRQLAACRLLTVLRPRGTGPRPAPGGGGAARRCSGSSSRVRRARSPRVLLRQLRPTRMHRLGRRIRPVRRSPPTPPCTGGVATARMRLRRAAAWRRRAASRAVASSRLLIRPPATRPMPTAATHAHRPPAAADSEPLGRRRAVRTGLAGLPWT